MSRLLGTNLVHVKQKNDESIKEVIYKFGPISRVKIAEMLALTPPTITSNIASLIARGIVEELSDKENPSDVSLGRKPVKIDFIKSAYYFIGVEMAPGKTILCITDLRSNLVSHKVDAAVEHEYDYYVKHVADTIVEMLAQAGIKKEKVAGIGVGVPGFVESSKGMVRYYGRYGWRDKTLAKDLEELTGINVVIDNNARVRIIGEDLLDKKNRPDIFAYYFISKGIACPLMIRNRMVSGQTSGAGEAGHMVIEINGKKCETCGNHGCLEAYASENALLNQCREIMDDKNTILNDIQSDPGLLTLDDILSAEAQNDEIIVSTVKNVISYLAIALANIVNLISPKLVIVDSYIMKLDINRKYFIQVLKSNLYGLNDTEVEIEFKEYDSLSGAKGAVALAIKKFFIERVENNQ